MKRVVITGYGTISSSGNDAETLWSNVLNGKSGIRKITDLAYAGIACQIAGIMEGFDAGKYLDKKDSRNFDLFAQYAYVSTMQALEMAGASTNNFDKSRVGIYVGSGIGGISTILKNYEKFIEKGSRRVSPLMIPMMISNIASGIIAIKTGFTGASYSPVSACATSNHAIGEGFLRIKHGYADAIIAGGAESPINPLAFAGFSNMNAMSTNNENPAQACRPFDKLRDGFVMSEGAGILFLEEMEHAKKRNAKILGEIVGYGATTDAFHITTPDFHGAKNAMKTALEMANVSFDQIDYINAHATGTKTGDKSENMAIESLFMEHAQDLLISATKSSTGHLFGAAGGIEAIITLKALENAKIPPTINLDEPDDEFALNYVPNDAIERHINYALSNGFGFGGHNASLLFKKWEN